VSCLRIYFQKHSKTIRPLFLTDQNYDKPGQKTTIYSVIFNYIYFGLEVHHQVKHKNKKYTVFPTRYPTRNFFNNSNTSEGIAMKFEQEYVRCVRNENECVCSVCL